MKVAEFLAQHPRVARVHYPGLQSHPAHKIAAGQMSEFGGMLSLEVKDGYDAAMSVAAKTKIFIRATSLGGVESLIEHRASIEGPDHNLARRLAARVHRPRKRRRPDRGPRSGAGVVAFVVVSAVPSGSARPKLNALRTAHATAFGRFR